MNELNEEIEVLISIYNDSSNDISIKYDELINKVVYNDKILNITIDIYINNNYPSIIPNITINYDKMTNKDVEILDQLIIDKMKSMVGTCMIYDTIEYIKSYITDYKSIDNKINDNIDSNISEIDLPIELTDNSLNIYHSEITIEKKSSFQSHFIIIQSLDDIKKFRSTITTDKRCSKATHNIFAYRFQCPVTSILYHDCDDDGETAAGKRLAEMIRLMNINNVAVIVSRWFGGILLGPDRFKYICNSARNLLEAHGFGLKSDKR